jgi:DNA-binding MarR family transcriptional regulator
VRGNFHAETVPLQLLYGTTVAVVNNVPDGSQLEQLLAQLLRAVTPAFGAERPQATAAAAAGLKSAPPEAYAVSSPPGARDSASGPGNEQLPSVSGSEARALIELMSARGIAQGELAGLLGLDKSTVSRLAAGLERKGWIRRGRDEDNQRYVRLYLTAQGAEVAGRVWQAWDSRQARILAALSEEERAGLSAGLQGLVRGLAAEGILGGAEPPAPGQDVPAR